MPIFPVFSFPDTESVCTRFTFHSGSRQVWLFPWDWRSFPGFGGVRTSQSFHIYLSLRPNWTNANKHVFQVYLGHSGHCLCVTGWERRETAQSPADNTQGALGATGWLAASRLPGQGCTGPASARSQTLGLSAVHTAPPHSPVPREGILRKKKEPGSLETLN